MISPYRTMKRLSTADEKYRAAIERVEAEIKDSVEFEFFIQWQPSDGFVMVHHDGAYNAPLRECLFVIKEAGCLSEVDYMKLRI